MERKTKQEKIRRKEKTIREIMIEIQRDNFAMKEVKQLVKCPL